MAKGKAVEEYSDPASDMHSLMQAEKVRANPKRHAAARAHAKGQMALMQKVHGSPLGAETQGEIPGTEVMKPGAAKAK